LQIFPRLIAGIRFEEFRRLITTASGSIHIAFIYESQPERDESLSDQLSILCVFCVFDRISGVLAR
jgi:hypothetical protein